MALTGLQKKFVNEYLRCFNASEAARLAGYSEKAAGQQGYENLRKPEIAEVINEYFDAMLMESKEALARLSDMARASIEDFVDIDPNLKNAVFLNFSKAKEDGKLHLIKKLKYNAQGYPEIELHDAQAALIQIAKHHGLFKEDSSAPVINNIIPIEAINYRNAITSLAPRPMGDSETSSED